MKKPQSLQMLAGSDLFAAFAVFCFRIRTALDVRQEIMREPAEGLERRSRPSMMVG
jgi:hypothetical protein